MITLNANDFPWEYSSPRPLAEAQAQPSHNDKGSQNLPNTNPPTAPQIQIPEGLNQQVEAVDEGNSFNSSFNEEQISNEGPLPTTNTQCENPHNQ